MIKNKSNYAISILENALVKEKDVYSKIQSLIMRSAIECNISQIEEAIEKLKTKEK